jgi:hypothetical protein
MSGAMVVTIDARGRIEEKDALGVCFGMSFFGVVPHNLGRDSVAQTRPASISTINMPLGLQLPEHARLQQYPSRALYA